MHESDPYKTDEGFDYQPSSSNSEDENGREEQHEVLVQNRTRKRARREEN